VHSNSPETGFGSPKRTSGRLLVVRGFTNSYAGRSLHIFTKADIPTRVLSLFNRAVPIRADVSRSSPVSEKEE
jgi:hypothetical protein